MAINAAPMATNQGFKSFVPDAKKLDAKYLYHWLRANRSYLESLGNGATFKEVSKAVVARLQLPLPPISEQKRIAAILDVADALRAKRRAALAKLDQLGQAIFVEMFGDPTEAIESGKYRELQDVVARGRTITYGIVQAGPNIGGGIPYIRTGDIKDGEILECQLLRTSAEIAKSYERSKVSTGDIVMSIRATVGTMAVVPLSLDGANLTQGTARISPGPDVVPEFLLFYLRSPAIQAWIQRQVKGATFREITLGRLRQLPVVVPQLAEQHEFARRSRQLFFVRTAMKEATHSADWIFSSLQYRGFRGEL